MKHSISAINFYLLYLLVIMSLVFSSGCMVRNTDSSQEHLQQNDPANNGNNSDGSQNSDGGNQSEQNKNDRGKDNDTNNKDDATNKDSGAHDGRVNDAGNSKDAGQQDAQSHDMGTAQDATITIDAAKETTFSSVDAGFSVTLPEGVHAEATAIPTWATEDAVAAATVTQNDESYTTVVYPRNDAATIQDWAAQSKAGESFTPSETVPLESGELGQVYLTDDNGLLPNIHVVVMGEQNIYYFKWDAGLPEDPEEAADLIKRQELTFTVPDSLLDMLRATSVR